MAFTKIAAAGIGSTGTVTLENVVVTGSLNASSITGAASTANVRANSLTVSGVTTSSGGFVGNLTGNVNSTGVSTFSTILVGTAVTISGGIVTATGGFNLGISSAGTVITAGPVKTLNFVGAGNTFAVNGTTVDISISGGGGGGGGGSLTITNNTSTNSTFYPLFVDVTTGTPTANSVSSTKLNFNPSNGNFSATQFASLSDKNKKTNIRKIDNAIDITKQLEGVKFNWIDNNKPSLGLIAQDVEKVIPEIVETASDGTKSVSYGNIIGILIEAIKDQQVRIEDLEKRLNA